MADYSIRLVLSGVTANSNFSMTIYQDDKYGKWSFGSSDEGQAGLSIKSADGAVQFKTLRITPKNMTLYASDADLNIEVDLFVDNSQGTEVGGNATLPEGAVLTITTDADEQNVTSTGSWGVKL